MNGETSEECRKVSETKWQCSDESWNYVGLTTALFNGDQKQAVWAHPVTGKTLEIVFDVSENSRKLYFNSVFAESAYRSKNRAPVNVEISADENILLKYASHFSFSVIGKSTKIPESTAFGYFFALIRNQQNRCFAMHPSYEIRMALPCGED